VLASEGESADAESMERLVDLVRDFSRKLKRPLTGKEVVRLLHTCAGNSKSEGKT
jgi:hypothetical protein